MAARANYVKLGLFVVLGLVAVFTLGITAGALSLRRETNSYVTYFTESVQGLEVGAPVKARGVTIGRIDHITFAPDHETVAVKLDFYVRKLEAMGMGRRPMPPNVRAQLASQGLLGARYVALDVYDPATHPGPALRFEPPAKYIPSTPSTEKNLEVLVTKTLDGLAILSERLAHEGMAEKTVRAVTDLDTLLTDLNGMLRRLDWERLPSRTAKTIDEIRAAVGTLNETLGHLNGDAGLVATAQRAMASAAEVGRNATVATRDLRGVLDELRAAARAIRELAEQIDQHPDMLIKGRSKP